MEPDERAHMEQLIESAKSMHGIEQLREMGGHSVSFVTRQDGGAAISGGPGDVLTPQAEAALDMKALRPDDPADLN